MSVRLLTLGGSEPKTDIGIGISSHIIQIERERPGVAAIIPIATTDGELDPPPVDGLFKATNYSANLC